MEGPFLLNPEGFLLSMLVPGILFLLARSKPHKPRVKAPYLMEGSFSPDFRMTSKIARDSFGIRQSLLPSWIAFRGEV